MDGTSSGGFAVHHVILVVEELGQEVDVLHGQAEDLVLAELLVWRMGWDELPQIGEGTVHVLLPPALTGVRENPSHDFGL